MKKKIAARALSLLLALLLMTAGAVTAGAAGTASSDGSSVGGRPLPEMPGGDFGTCSWLLSIPGGKLTLSGTGSTGGFSEAEKPWAEYNDAITEVVVMNGVTTLGRSVFADTPHLKKVSMAPSVTVIERDAFYKCPELTEAVLPAGIGSIGIGAFLGTGMGTVTILNKSCVIDPYALGYMEGRNHQLFPKTDFLIYGYAGSTAQRYADSNSLTFVDLNGEGHYIYVDSGTAYNAFTDQEVERARAGEKIYVKPDKLERFKIFRSFYSDEVTLDETDWSFTMPDESVGVYMNYDDAYPMNIDLSGGSAYISGETYQYLVGLIRDGQLVGEQHENQTDAYTISLGDMEILLTPDRIYTYDYDYAPCYSEELTGDYIYNPVNFIFAENEIFQGHVDLTLPAAGSPWDYETMQADMVPTDEEWNTGRFTVANAVWYDHWGISAFDTFEGGEFYFVGFDLVPNDSYFFTLNTEVVLHVSGTDRTIRLDPMYLNEDGSVRYSNGKPENLQIRLVGGEPHRITVENGYAYLPGSDVPVTQAVPGQEVRIRYDVNCIEPNEYFVWGSMAASSDDAEVSSMEMVDTWHLYMPDKDVSVHVSYETGIQKDTVLELYNGPVTVPEDNTQRSENFGAAAVLRMKAADNEYGDGVTNYDIDGDGSYDIQCANKNVYSLLPTCSLTHNVKLTTTRRETEHYPVRSVEILVKKAVSHKITVTGGGVATARRSDYANEYVLTEACEGETVYLMPKLNEIDEDSYVVQFSMSASSADVHIIDEPVPEFVMPDKDVTVSFDFECRVQKNSVLDFSSGKTVSVPANPEETGARSESYGVSMVFRLASVSQTDVSDTVRRFDVDGNGSCDIEQNTADNSYTLLDTNSLPTGYALVLSREDSWTLPVRTVRIELPRPAPVRGDANRDGKITIDDATLLQRHLAEYLNPFGKGLINEDNEDWFFCIDANKDGRINVRDVTAIQRMLAES